MARPIKNSCDYFPHDAGMRNHKKVKSIRAKFANGFAIWVMLIEYLTESDGNEFEYDEMEFELMAGDFGFSSEEIKAVVDYTIKIEMLFNKNGFVHSESLDERLAPVYQKRGRLKELSAKQLRKNGRFYSDNTATPDVSVTETPQSKVNKSKEEKIKEKQLAFYQSLTIYLDEFGKDILRDFYNYWSEPNKTLTKLRWELEKTWDAKLRLSRWVNNNKSFNNEPAPTSNPNKFKELLQNQKNDK